MGRFFMAPCAVRAIARSAAIAIATLVACTPAPETQAPSPSPSASAARAPASPRPVPSPVTVGHGTDAGFGFVNTGVVSVTPQSVVTLRTETSDAVVQSFNGALPGVAVSLNGQKVGYWTASTNVAGPVQRYELIVYDTIQRTFTAPLFTSGSEVPVTLLWSSDGTGLVFSTQTYLGRGPLSNVPTSIHTSWFALDVASTQARELVPLEGLAEHVYSWDRATDTFTASRSMSAAPPATPSGVASVASGVFLVLSPAELKRFLIPAHWIIGAADPYGRSVALLATTTCDDGTLRCPSLEVRDQRTFTVVAPQRTLASAPVRDFPTVTFRPRSQDLIVHQTYFNASPTVELWEDLGHGRRVALFHPHRELPSGGFSSTDVHQIIARPDGGAAYLLQFDGSQHGRWFGDLVSLSDGKLVGGIDITVGGNPVASVVLDPTYAARIDGRAPPPSLCDTYVQAVLPSPGPAITYPTTTAAQVRAGLASDALFRHLLEDIAGVRQDANPLRDRRVLRCDVVGIELGEPVFVRAYPTAAGVWYVSLRYRGEQLMLATVGRDAAGTGAQSGSVGLLNRFPWIDDATAKQVGGTASDPAVSAELVFAKQPRQRREAVPAWRVVRASGAAAYVFEDVLVPYPNGVVAPAAEVETGP